MVSEQEQSTWRGPADRGIALAQLIRSGRCQLESNWLPDLHSVLGPSVAFSEPGLGLPSSALALFQSLLILGWSTITNHRPRCPALPQISVHGGQPPSAGISVPEESKAPQRDQTVGGHLALIFQPHERLPGAAQILSQVCLMVSEVPGPRGSLLGSLGLWAPTSLISTRTFFSKDV